MILGFRKKVGDDVVKMCGGGLFIIYQFIFFFFIFGAPGGGGGEGYSGQHFVSTPKSVLF